MSLKHKLSPTTVEFEIFYYIYLKKKKDIWGASISLSNAVRCKVLNLNNAVQISLIGHHFQIHLMW